MKTGVSPLPIPHKGEESPAARSKRLVEKVTSLTTSCYLSLDFIAAITTIANTTAAVLATRTETKIEIHLLTQAHGFNQREGMFRFLRERKREREREMEGEGGREIGGGRGTDRQTDRGREREIK